MYSNHDASQFLLSMLPFSICRNFQEYRREDSTCGRNWWGQEYVGRKLCVAARFPDMFIHLNKQVVGQHCGEIAPNIVSYNTF